MTNNDVVRLRRRLERIGDCVIVVSDLSVVKVHVHTNDPGLALQKGLSYGALTSMKIDNMREEHNERLFKDAEKLSKLQQKEDTEKAVKMTMFCLKDVGVDPETGQIDADIVSGGTPKSDRDKIQRVTEEIKLLEEEFAGDAPLNVLISNMSEKYGVSQEKTEQIVGNLVQKGVIYQPTTG